MAGYPIKETLNLHFYTGANYGIEIGDKSQLETQLFFLQSLRRIYFRFYFPAIHFVVHPSVKLSLKKVFYLYICNRNDSKKDDNAEELQTSR